MSLLNGLRVVQIGGGLAAAVCGRLLSDVGAEVACIGADCSSLLARYLNNGKPIVAREALASADMIICEGRPSELRACGCDAAALRTENATAALVFISPYGQTGPKADDPASDLTLLFSSGIARLLTGQVDDLAEAPIRPWASSQRSSAGLAAACAGMHAALPAHGGCGHRCVDPGSAGDDGNERTDQRRTAWQKPLRKRVSDGNGATVCILPASDGYTAISPREDRQWDAWLRAMGSPEWGDDPRFVTKPNRVANWDALYALMSAWSRQHDKQWIADAAQAEHVPSFPCASWRNTSTRRSCGIADSTGATSLADESCGCRARRLASAWRARDRSRRRPRATAAIGHSRAGFQLGDRWTDDDAIPRSDGRGCDQGRGARSRRSWSRVRAAYGAWTGEERRSCLT